MTPQQKLHAVETAIRKALPRLMEIREGCYLERKGNIYKIVNERILLGRDSHHIYFAISPNYHQKPDFLEINEIYLDEYEILGHYILLSDVLEWLKRKWKHIGILLMDDGIMLINFRETKLDKGKLDLSKPYLKDQSEELWDFLYNLIKED